MESTPEIKDKPANIKTPYHAPKHFKITAFCDAVASGRLVPEVPWLRLCNIKYVNIELGRTWMQAVMA
jgi:hypothetical protein